MILPTFDWKLIGKNSLPLFFHLTFVFVLVKGREGEEIADIPATTT